jgi:hypothetical protein
MELTGYVEALRGALATAAAAGGDDAVQLAERLTGPLDAAARLVLQEALADAAQEITRDLAPGSVELRLRGRDLAFVVSQPPALDPTDEFSPDRVGLSSERGADAAGDGATSRISFRPPDHLKARIEEAAERDGLSVNAFLVRTLANVLEPGKQSSARKDPEGGEHVGGWYR